MKIDKIVNDDDLIEFLSEQYKQTNNLNFIAAAHAIELYRRSNEILSWQLAQHDWIRVDERLPEHGEHVLVYSSKYDPIVECRDLVTYMRMGNYSGVTHWMPLPEPPVEKEN